MKFKYKDWDLYDAVDVLMAYDHGVTDSGVNDPELRKAVKEYLKSLTEDEFNSWAMDYILIYYIAPGHHTLADISSFINWLEENND